MSARWITPNPDDTFVVVCGDDGGAARVVGCGEPFEPGEGAWLYRDGDREMLLHEDCAV